MTDRLWAVVPAAGIGQRMSSELPKQYLTLHGRTIIELSLAPILAHPRIERVVVALASDDRWWPDTALAGHAKVIRVDGGAERAASVMNGLAKLSEGASDNDWVLVHDAARPCLRAGDLSKLIDELAGDPVGGLLAVPVHDTVKRADDDGLVAETLPREQLWRAYTPQMFRFGLLRQSLAAALATGRAVTDDASAMEQAGWSPRLIAGHADNIKVTTPEDLPLAAFTLEQIRHTK